MANKHIPDSIAGVELHPLARSPLPDFDRLATIFDRYLPLIEPVGDAVLEHLAAVPDGGQVLDVACGTGEPGLTFARRSPGVRVVGIDAADGMVQLARAKAERDGLGNIRFEAMAAESMTFADESMGGVISRFGFLMFGDTVACARQLARVLRPGGGFSIAVWDDVSTNTLVRLVIDALRPRIPTELVAPFEHLEGAHARDRLREAGLTHVESAPFEWHYAFPDEESLWQFVSGPGVFGRQFAVLDDDAKRAVRADVERSFSPYREANGYRIPHTCRMHWGRR